MMLKRWYILRSTVQGHVLLRGRVAGGPASNYA